MITYIGTFQYVVDDVSDIVRSFEYFIANCHAASIWFAQRISASLAGFAIVVDTLIISRQSPTFTVIVSLAGVNVIKSCMYTWLMQLH